MSYLVLGLGILLSLCGAIAFYTGYGIIEVERGWASVIAGSVAFSCGIVTVALGLILHRLARLPAILHAGQGDTSQPGGFAWRMDDEPPSVTQPEYSFEPQPAAVQPVAAAPIPSPRSWAKRPIRSNLTAARSFLKPRGHVPPPARGLPEAEYSTLKAPPFSDGGDLNQDGPEPALEPEFFIPPEVAMKEAETETEAWASFAPPEKPGLFGTAPNEKIAASSFEEPFLEIKDNGKPQVQSEPGTSWPPAAIETIFEEELFIELHRKPEKRAGEPVSSPAMPPQQPPLDAPQAITSGGQGELAIVGQYQSEGTSYIMYSDGSIEARTEHAVFHFKSMTELKAFMDSEARTSKD
jgi:hypothetical protein